MAVSMTRQAYAAAPYLVPGWRSTSASRPRAIARPRRRAMPRVPGGAVWVPARTAPETGVARFCRRFADDRKLIRLKLVLLAALVVATAAFERVM